MGEVIDLGVATKGEIPPEKVIGGALDANLASVLVIGETQDGDLYFASSGSNGPEILWLLESAKKLLFETASEE